MREQEPMRACIHARLDVPASLSDHTYARASNAHARACSLEIRTSPAASISCQCGDGVDAALQQRMLSCLWGGDAPVADRVVALAAAPHRQTRPPSSLARATCAPTPRNTRSCVLETEEQSEHVCRGSRGGDGMQQGRPCQFISFYPWEPAGRGGRDFHRITRRRG